MTNDESNSNDEVPMTKQESARASETKFDLEERSAKFGEAVIRFVKRVQLNGSARIKR
jgi:hypothetical protein